MSGNDETLQSLEKTRTMVARMEPVDFGERYELIGLVGQGGMGAVYKVRDLELEEVVALKALRPELMRDRRAALRFRREVKLARRVTHPNVARIYDLRLDGDVVQLTMEYIEGRALGDELIERGRLPAHEVIRYVQEVCKGLRAAHEAAVVHRDLKPDNIMITPEGRVVITDFGIATTHQDDQEGEFVGTPHYVAPEQARGQAVDGRTDIYALGVMMFEMLSGSLPWQADTIGELIMRRLFEPPPALPDDVDAPDRLRGIVLRCMATEPAQRYADVGQLAAALDAVSGMHTLDPPARVTATNIDPSPNAFVGRVAECTELVERVTGAQRLVTLLGPGGTGKTRLARETGRGLVDHFEGGVWFVDLSDANDTATIVEALGRVLDVPSGDAARIGRALDARGAVLLVLDNLERIVAEAAALIGNWLAAAPGLTIVATSRVRVGLSSEHVLPVAPLEASLAAELFEQRVRMVRPDYSADSERETVLEIVDRVDGLPLAVELIAAQMRMLDEKRLLERLDDRFRALRGSNRDRPDRHATMASVLDGSWDLLSESGRAALAQLSVFRGGATLDAACQVIDVSDQPGSPWPEEVIEELWDHSLVRWATTSGERLTMLDMVREYAGAKLPDASGPIARHGEVYAALGVDLGLNIDRDVRARLSLELANLEAACVRAVERDDRVVAERTLRALDAVQAAEGRTDAVLFERVYSMPLDADQRARVGALLSHAYRRLGRLDDAMPLIETALEDAQRRDDQRAVGELLLGQAFIHWTHADGSAALAAAEGALTIALTAEDRDLEARARDRAALVYWNRGDLDRAQAGFERAVELHRELGSAAAALGLGHLGVVHADRGDLDRACEYYQESVDLFRAEGSQVREALMLTNLGTARDYQGRGAEAREIWKRALTLTKLTGDLRSTALVLLNLGTSEVEAGHTEQGITYLEQSLTEFRALEEHRYVGIVLGSLGLGLAQRGAPDAAERAFDESEEILNGAQDRFSLARLHTKRGRAAVMRGDRMTAERCLAAARDLSEVIGAGPESQLTQSVEQLAAALRD